MPRRVLIADDDSLFCKILQYTLEQSGMDWIVETAATGRETIDTITKQAPDLLVLDLKMPEGDGFTVLEERKQLSHTYPVMVVTHLMSNDHEQRCSELGASSVVGKARIRMSDLVAMMQRTLASSL